MARCARGPPPPRRDALAQARWDHEYPRSVPSHICNRLDVHAELFPHELPDGSSIQSGGMGAFASLSSLLRILSALLSSDPALGLSKETLDEMFTDQLDGKRVKLSGEVLNAPGESFAPELAPSLPGDPRFVCLCIHTIGLIPLPTSRKGLGLSWMIMHVRPVVSLSQPFILTLPLQNGLPNGRSPGSVMWSGCVSYPPAVLAQLLILFLYPRMANCYWA